MCDTIEPMRTFICLLICLLISPFGVEAACPNVKPKVIINTTQGKVKYITNMARKDFIAKYPGTSDTTLGLTVAKLEVKTSGKSSISQKSRQMCAGLDEIIFTIGYDEILVYIHKNYKPGSCQYRVVKDHENYHVAVHRQAMTFFKPDIETALRKAVAKLKPQVVHSHAEAKRLVDQQFRQIQNEIAPLLRHINTKIKEKNDAIDTPESYKASSKLCDEW